METSVSIDGNVQPAGPQGQAPPGQRHPRRGQPRHVRGRAARPWRRSRSSRQATRSWSEPQKSDDRAAVLRRRPAGRLLLPAGADEIDAHGGGIDARGATFPGAGPYVELGRGIDFSWSATSAGNDNIDIFVEELCGDDTHYLFDGECLEMESFDAGRVGFGAGTPVVFNETVHGPVLGYATVDGERVALSSARTTRGREVMAAFPFADLNANVPTDAESFFDVVSEIEFTFNWFYADDKDVAMYSGGRLPVRHPHVDIGLPTKGSGRYEWRGFLDADKHPHGTTPADGTIVNWNNKPARRLGGGGRQLELRLGAPQQPAGAHGRPARDALAGVRGRGDEQGRHAGPAVGEGDQRRAVGVRDRARAEPARPADGRAAPGLADAGIAPARPRQRRHDRPSGGGHPGQGMAEDRGRGDGAGARSAARRPGLAHEP